MQIWFPDSGKMKGGKLRVSNLLVSHFKGKTSEFCQNRQASPFEGKLSSSDDWWGVACDSKRYPCKSSCSNNGHCVSYTSFDVLRTPLFSPKVRLNFSLNKFVHVPFEIIFAVQIWFPYSEKVKRVKAWSCRLASLPLRGKNFGVLPNPSGFPFWGEAVTARWLMRCSLRQQALYKL